LLDKPGYTAAGTLMPSKLRSMHLGFWEDATGTLAADMARCTRRHWQSAGGFSDRISAKAGKQIARDVNNYRSVKGATADGPHAIVPVVLKEER
jgi:hypothetical protein